MEPIRILQMIGGLDLGGSQAIVMNIYRNIDKNKVQFDFIIDHDDERELASEVETLGGKIYSMPRFTGWNLSEIRSAWNDFFRSHPEYKVLHSHVRSYASIYFSIAKKYGVKTIIHSHSTSNGSGVQSLIKHMLQYPLRYQADYCFGCSKIAGEWLFGKNTVNSRKYFLVKNAVDISRFRFNPMIRSKVRKEFGFSESDIVAGHVGRLHEAKNHMYLLSVFNELKKNNTCTKLIIVGTGELENDIRKRVSELNLEDSVIMTGSRKDVNEIMQAMDIFIFPSKWEGLPVTVVEAQAAGLPCYVSDTITSEVNVSDLVHVLSISDDPEKWMREISNNCNKRENVEQNIVDSGFDIMSTAIWMEDFYRVVNDGKVYNAS